MVTKKTSSTLRFVGSFAAGILISMISVYLLHFFGTWESAIDRPDADTTGSVVVYNECVLLGDTHTLRPTASLTSKESANELKFAGSFMNFFDGHIVIMIVVAFALAFILFAIKKSAKSLPSSSPNFS